MLKTIKRRGEMKIDNYTLKNWRELLDKDWNYLRKDYGSANVENIIDTLLNAKNNQNPTRDN